MSTAESAEDTAPAAGWHDVTVPGVTWLNPAENTHFVWYRRQLSIPASDTNKRVFIYFGGARYAPVLYVNGIRVVEQFNGFAPFDAEITPWVTAGKEFNIAIRCQDRTATFVPGYDAKHPGAKGYMITPAGGYKEFIGLWDDSALITTPRTRIAEHELTITTSTRQRTLSISGKIVGDSVPAVVSGRVLDHGITALVIPNSTVGADGNFSFTIPFRNAHFWSPEDPHLYTLQLDLARSNTEVPIDTLEQQFGFKEVWTIGPDLFLNGAKRHLLATSTWPKPGPDSNETIEADVKKIRATNAICFRLHNQLWPEEWLKAADEEGLLIVDESPLYTDGNGDYAYNDPRFWKNYRDEIAGMIRRDRNHPSLVMWSLGNEILFMGNEKYDSNLPKELGDTGRFAKQLDPSHPITFEADQDPDNAFDVIGLHYPHEMPNVYDYPNTTDWLAGRTITEAGGGLLGTRSTEFLWERKKPLYIGEYLWEPYNDYSVGTIFNGDNAYLNRETFYNRSKRLAFYDQTIGYRRSGVTGMCPWTVTGIDSPAEWISTAKSYNAPLAAFPRQRGFRYFGGLIAAPSFDVFDDDGRDHLITVQLVHLGSVLARKSFQMKSGEYRKLTLSFRTPDVLKKTSYGLNVQLLSDGKLSWGTSVPAKIYPELKLHCPHGSQLLMYDPTGSWPGSIQSLANIKPDAISHTIVVVVPMALGKVSASMTTVIKGRSDGAAILMSYIRKGGRALVLDQATLSPLGLDIDLVDHASTMTFPLRTQEPLLEGLNSEDLCSWGDNNYVTQREIVRYGKFGMKSLVVSGGPDCLGQSPVVEERVGSGYIMLMQALAIEKKGEDPAAALLLQNAVNYIATKHSQAPKPLTVISDDSVFTSKLANLNLDLASSDYSQIHSKHGVNSLLLSGGGARIESSSGQITDVLNGRGVVYWHNPDPTAFSKLAPYLGAGALAVITEDRGTSLRDRENPLLSGISREDLTYTTPPQSWTRNIEPDTKASTCQFVPQTALEDRGVEMAASTWVLDGGKADSVTHTASFTNSGSILVSPLVHAKGLYPLTITASCNLNTASFPVLRVESNNIDSCWLPINQSGTNTYRVLVDLVPGINRISLSIQESNAGDQNSNVSISAIRFGDTVKYPPGMEILAMPGSLVTWPHGNGRVVLDGVNWDNDLQNDFRGERYAGALFANLGFPFTHIVEKAQYQQIPLNSFSLSGSSPYFSASDDEIQLRSNGLVVSPVSFQSSGEYRLRINGYSTPCQGVFAMAKFTLDGAAISTTEIKSSSSQWFDAGTCKVTKGPHQIGVAFTNDAFAGTEDRNLYVRGVEIAPN